MEVVGGAVLSALLEPLVGKLSSGELMKFARKKDVEEELKKWTSRLFEINAVLRDAEQKQITSLAVKSWLSKLRDLAYDVEDVLDEFQTEALASKFKSESGVNTSTALRLIPTCFAGLKPRVVMCDVKKRSKLQKITVKLDEIVKEKNNLCLRINAGGRSAGHRRVTTSLVNESDIFGRESDKEAVVRLLMNSEASDSRFLVIPIIGIGGVGKTTLAQLVYNDVSAEFDYKAWVCVSDDFDIVKITKTILHWENCEANDLNKLQELLKEKLSGKKFLIVLDDVWSKNYEDWTTLSVPFSAGELGSKIIITTRSEDVASRMGSIRGYPLEKLSSYECLCIFNKHALDARNLDTHSHLKDIGGKIAERCMGLPLAAKTLGGLLRHKQNRRDWEDILNSEIWDLPEEESGILPALKLSYHDLPSHLKQCFAYCAIFPKEYEFDENELVLLWMAEGFLQQQEKKKAAEDLGHEYFRELSSRLLFQQSSMNKSKYVMHALIADLARSVSQEICFNLDDSWKGGFIHEQTKLGSAKIRHSAFSCHRYDISKRFEVYNEMKSLRTFLALPISSSPENYFYHLSGKVLTELVHKLRRLRALSLAGYSLVDLPSSICALKHLRYLNLSYTAITRLPKSLSELFNLQTLNLHGCSELVELPSDIGNLINLHYLDISDTNSLQEMPLQISKLTYLRLLPKFIVGQGNGLGIKELMKLSHLQGQLWIIGLQNVVNVRDAELSGLHEKLGLDELALEWIDNFQVSRNGGDELHVLSSLQPHRSLEKLSIISYGGTVFPSWVGDPLFTKMVDLQLCSCRKITSLPPLGKLPVLRHLSIKGMDEVKEVAAEDFPSLETLIIEDMLGWEQWSWPNGINEDVGKFPKLRELTLGNCPVLIGKLPSYLLSLQKLEVYNCPRVTCLPEMLPCLRELNVGECQEEIFRSVPVLTSLRCLKIRRISGLVSFHEAFLQALVELQDLKMEDCNELECLWQDGSNLDKLTNLKHLRIYYCEQLVSLIKGEEGFLPCNLEVLQVIGCHNLEKLPNGLHSLKSLRELEICKCPKLVSFSERAGLPDTLKRLEINECVLLEYLPEGLMTMTDENNSNQSLLEELWILECPSLKSFPRGKVPTTLKSLYIWGCLNIKSIPKGIMSNDTKGMCFSHLEDLSVDSLSLTSFPDGEFPTSLKTLHIFNYNAKQFPSLSSLSNLTYLNISNCPELESFPERGLHLQNLASFTIWDCDKLRSLPSHMDKLTFLQDLSIQNCHCLTSLSESGLPPNLISLTMRNCKNLTQPLSGWRLRSLSSLKHLEFGGISPCTDVDFFPDDDGLFLPSSLTSLWITNHKNMKSISRGIHKLTSIEELRIGSCPKLQFLPDERFPATLGRLLIRSCPLLEQQCSKEKGDYWPIIAPIPYVEIDGYFLPYLKER